VKIPVLDHGYVEFIEAWGHGKDGAGCHPPGVDNTDYEVGLIEAARQSTQGNFRGWDQDAKLLGFLYNNNHATPFEFAGMIIEVQAPIFVFREWHRHRTQSYNEMSARYSPLPDLYYKPTTMRCIPADTDNKQAQGIGGKQVSQSDAEQWLNDVAGFLWKAEDLYQQGLKLGLPKEIARVVMPVGHYSRMRASANLRNWLSFLTLRMDPKAQWEIRQFAEAVGEIVALTFPLTWKLFNEKVNI
jgi:thymidylate synthase (FAD)